MMKTIVDNELFLLIRRYGFIGMATFVALFVSFYLGLSKIRARRQLWK